MYGTNFSALALHHGHFEIAVDMLPYSVNTVFSGQLLRGPNSVFHFKCANKASCVALLYSSVCNRDVQYLMCILVEHSSEQCSVVQCSVVQCSVVQCTAVYCSVLYNNVVGFTIVLSSELQCSLVWSVVIIELFCSGAFSSNMQRSSVQCSIQW